MNNKQNFRELLFVMTISVIVILWIPRICAANEKDEIVSKHDSYTFVLCYYDDALDYAIANLESQDTDSQKFAMDIAERVINLRLRGDDSSKEIKLFSLFQKTQASRHMKFESAVAQARLGSIEGLDILLEEFKSKELSYDSRLHALRFILDQVEPEPFKELFKLALDDDIKVGALGALGLFRIGDETAKQWLLEKVYYSPLSRPSNEILEVIQETKVTEAIPLLKPWLTYENSNMSELEVRSRKLSAAVTLAILGDQDGKESLLSILSTYKENTSGIIGRAAFGVAAIKDDTLIPLLREALSVKSRSDKFNVIEALLLLNDPDIIQDILEELKSKDGWENKAVQLAIKYNITQSLPELEYMFEQKNKKEQLEILLQKNEPTLLSYYEQMGVTKEVALKGLYLDKYHECVTLALGVYQMNPNKGIKYIKALLLREDIQIADNASTQRIFDIIVENKIYEVISLLPPMLDSVDPYFRSKVLKCLEKLTGQKLPPENKIWEQWIKDNIE